MVHSTLVQMGSNLERIDTEPAHALGTKTHGSDGHSWIYVQATGAVAGDTDVILTEPAMTVAAGAGSFMTGPNAVAINEYCWVRDKTAA